MEDNERDEMFKDLIEDTKKRICELNEEGAEVSRSLMAYTMCKLIMDKQFVEILTENKVELKDFIDVISHLFYAEFEFEAKVRTSERPTKPLIAN